MTLALAVERTSTKSTWTWMPGFPAGVPGILGLRPRIGKTPRVFVQTCGPRRNKLERASFSWRQGNACEIYP